jgi:glycosyltransferase involved in cell wall biosynthesis
MKLFLIKLGKAFVAIRRDGIFVGGRRVLSYLGTFLKTIFTFSSGDVLFITGGVGDSANYRAYNVAEELNLHGFKASVMIQDNPFLPHFASRFKIFVFHRTLFTPTVARLVGNIKAQNKEIIFETDDLVFDTKYIHASSFFQNISVLEKKQYATGVAAEILQDDYVKVATTTTTYIAKILENYGKKVFVVRQGLSLKDLKITDAILKNKVRELATVDHEPIKIGYFSGTISHNKDFATVTDALLALMEKYPQVELFLAGPLDTQNALNKFKDRVKQIPFAPRAQHFANVASVDINIAPLEIGDPFCEARSELKFFEAGIVQVPTVAAATQTFKEAMIDGLDGFVADGTAEWTEKLERLITDEKLRGLMGERAREVALKNYTTKNSHNEEYYAYLRAKLK